ncbi:MAG: MFS transporter [Hyphomicrobium sp.]
MSHAPQMSAERERAILWALLFGNFVTGTGILLPAGMLSELATGLTVSVPKAGGLLFVSGVLVAIGAPLIAAFTSRLDRRALLTFSLVLYAASHVVSAIATNFEVVLAARVAMAVSAAIFTPQAAATLGALLPPERRSQAITMIFVGWSLATVGGMPLGGYIAHAFGWQAAFAVVAALSVLAAFAVAATIPAGVRIAALSSDSWRRVFVSPALLLVLLVTMLNGTGQFTFFTYVSPSLKNSLAAGPEVITGVLALYGLSATLGNVAASRVVGDLGPARGALIALLGMTAGLALWGAAPHILYVVLAGATFWGLGTFAVNSIQQARLASLAPDISSASIALNTSAIYLGQAAGSGLGGALITGGMMQALAWTAAAILLSAAAVSVVAQRYERQ